MSLKFQPIEASDIKMLSGYFGKRSNKTCDSMCFDSYLWREYYHVRYAVSGGEAIQWIMQENGVYHSAMPVCPQEKLPFYFKEIVKYFNEVLKMPFKIYLADEEAVEYLHLKESEEFEVTEQTDLKDYLYDAQALKTLSGRKLHKKKNHLNSFLKEYEGRYEYRALTENDMDETWEFLKKWREKKGENVEKHLDYEIRGVHEILRHCLEVPVKMAGVFIDGQLEAFTMGSYNAFEKMAIIHIEKANTQIRGLYQFINQQFLIREFPEAELVNREDDLGEEGLRHAKMSYNPVGFAKKYLVMQKNYDAKKQIGRN
ncbi:MAG: phosphatidylglycerol lysyltransferase domain-containing protein [Eubacteriales bacterium]|nr:phosphatidylglycerol lysyltransferase domain-containing protein [Eubacteriales bacterium]